MLESRGREIRNKANNYNDMIIKNILTELETAEKPVGKMLRKGTAFHVLAIGFKKGMILPKHTSSLPARLVVIKGEVSYNNAEGSNRLKLYDEYEIPVDEPRWVEASEESVILVIKG